MLTVGSLFSGIGGLDLGLERAGMKVIWQSEIDPYACRVLAKHWPEVPNHGNIKEIDWGDIVRPDILCGGYPCQPFSQAGKRRGEEDPRHLWPWVRDAISHLRPRYAILENVRGHLSLGGTSVLGELASIGYDAEWRVVSAASVGANHRRDRIIIVAYPHDTGSHSTQEHTAEAGEPSFGRTGGRCTNVAYPDSGGMEGQRPEQQTTGACRNGQKMADTASGDGRVTEPHGLRTVYGEAAKLGEQGRLGRSISSWWETEPDVGRVAHGIPDRVDRLRGLGNAVVPQVAEVIGRLVLEHAAHN